MKKVKKRCPTLQQNKSSSSSSWSDLGLDLLREINKKLGCYGDHIFRGVCRSWRAVNHGDERRRAADVLPWLMEVYIEKSNEKTLCYKLYEPPSPAKSNTSTIFTISHTINLYDYFSSDIFNPGYRVRLIRYVDGWLHISVVKSNLDTYFLFFSIATKASFTLPRFKQTMFPTYLALSATPESPDCVFLVLCLTHNCNRRTIGIFRHGDTHWTMTKSVEGRFGLPTYDAAVVCIHGVFYFLMTTGIGSYDLATGVLKVDAFPTLPKLFQFCGFFGLDGDLMLAYMDEETWKFCIRKYDWSNKDWVPLQSLGGRSVYLSNHSVYVDQINYYGISSANKIYVGIPSFAEEYTLEDGQLSKCPSTRCWTGLGSYTQFAKPIWVGPPDVLLRK